MSKRIPVACAAVALFLTTGCLAPATPSTGTAPADGPAEPQVEATTEYHPEPSEEESAAAEAEAEATPEYVGPIVANFDEKVTYPDGLELEVTEIRSQPLSEYGYASGDAEEGDPVTVLTVRVRNGSKAALTDQLTACSMTFGADGTAAETVVDEGLTDAAMSTLLPGKAKSGDLGFIVPSGARDDVVLECTVDYEYDTAIFTGSLD